jgi:hypothetical protein
MKTKHTANMQDHMTHGTGSLNADVWIDPALDLLSIGGDNKLAEPNPPVPQSQPVLPNVFAVTVNFPDMRLFHAVDNPPEYSSQPQLPEFEIIAPIHDWEIIPGKLQPPTFRVHRCHHPGVECGDENDDFELPFGFPEAVQHVQDSPDNVGCSTIPLVLTHITVLSCRIPHRE